MRYIYVLLLFVFACNVKAQEITLKKGGIMKGIQVNDTLSENFSLYIPTTFKGDQSWPVLFVLDMKGRAKQAMGMFVSSAEEQGYIVAASNDLSDTLSLTQNLLITNRMLNKVYSILPIKKEAIYVAGYREGGRYASLVPSFIKGVSGVLSLGANIANKEVLSIRKPFHFIGIVSREDYAYSDMLGAKNLLNKLKFPNQLILHDSGGQVSTYIGTALEFFKLRRMAKTPKELNAAFVQETYDRNMGDVEALLMKNRPLLADNRLSTLYDIYRPLRNVDSIKIKRKELSRSKVYKVKKREENALFLKQSFVFNDYNYYLEEDLLNYNYNNLGWWKYQKEQIIKLGNSAKLAEKQLGRRYYGYLYALTEDYLDMIKEETVVDEEALALLYMIKTIVSPKEYKNYLNVISITAKNEDYGASLFYLEELLSNGYTDKENLYQLEHTALLRIMPEFNETVAKYLKEARYDVITE